MELRIDYTMRGRKLSGVVEMFYILIGMWTIGVYTNANPYLIVHLVSVHFTHEHFMKILKIKCRC